VTHRRAKDLAGVGATAVATRHPELISPLEKPTTVSPGPDFQPAWNQDRRSARIGLKQASWRVLAYPDFRFYFTGATVSNLGTWLANTAQALLAYNLTHSVSAVGMVVCFQFMPVLIIGPVAGVVIARIGNLRTLLLATQLTSAVVAVTIAVLRFTGQLTVVWLAAGAFALGMAYCFALPVFSVLVPALVPPQETSAAIAMNAVSYNIGRAIGPALAVLVITFIGFGPVFLINAGSFLVLAAALGQLRPNYGLPRPATHPRLTDGFRIAKRDRIWLLLLMVAAVTIAADPVLVLGPPLAHHFGISNQWSGFFLSALGLGTVLGSLIRVPKPTLLRQAAYPLGVLGVAIIVFSMGINPGLCLAMAIITGVACLLTGAVTQTLLLDHAGQDRAAVMAVWAIAWAGSKPLASLADGVLAATFSVRIAGLLLALPALIPALFVIIVDGVGLQIIPRRWKYHLFSEVP
jgi:predicted MFS family arabinose efflux permease